MAALTGALALAVRVGAQVPGNAEIYAPPSDQSIEAFVEWHTDLEAWKQDTTAPIDFAAYEDSALRWGRTSFIQPQLMLHDKFIYARETGEWTVDKYLADVEARYGGVDSVLLWHAYPNIGVDDRNQFDLFKSLPGGVANLKKLVADFHARGVRVLLPYNPWDQLTRNSGQSDVQSLVDILAEVGADGFNGDTMDGANSSFYEYSVQVGHPVVVEVECPTTDIPDVATNVMSYTDITFPDYWPTAAPLLSSFKYLSGGRHLNIIRKRWATDRTDYIQHAFFNGAGFITWENIWGIWSQFSDRDSEAIRRVATVFRFLGEFVQGSSRWTPHLPITPPDSLVYASEFRNATHRVFLLIDRKWKATAAGPGPKSKINAEVKLSVPCTVLAAPAYSGGYELLEGLNCYEGRGATDLETPVGSSAGLMSLADCQGLCDATDNCSSIVYDREIGECYRRGALFSPLCEQADQDQTPRYSTYSKRGAAAVFWTDLYHGLPLDNTSITCDAVSGVGSVTVSVEDGYAAVMLSTAPRNAETLGFLSTMSSMTAVPLKDFEQAWTFLPQQRQSAAQAASPPAKLPSHAPKTVLLPGGLYNFSVRGNCIEGDDLPTAVDVQYDWEKHPQREHAQELEMPRLRMHVYPVSKVEYASFLNATGWLPTSVQNWLADWTPDRTVPAGHERQPVTWVSRNDAAAYCAHLGMRLPTSYEWQYAAQGTDGRPWPWGLRAEASRVPLFTTGRNMPAADNVDAHPTGASTFGVMDLVGNVYQWTDAFEDEHTVRAVLRGSPRWRPEGGGWYLPQPENLFEHTTFLLVSDSMDRSAGIGFRCVESLSADLFV